jgi:hypothetical protein
MNIRGIDLEDVRKLMEIMELLDADCYVNLLLPSLPQMETTHYSDIRIVRLDENKDQIHLTNRIGWMVEGNEDWASLDKLYEATVSLHDLLDESMAPNERIKLVQWQETEVQRVAKENETSEDGKSKKSIITKNWNKVDKSPRMDDVVAAVDKINAATRAISPCLSKQQANTRFPHVDYKDCYGCSEADVERVIRRINEAT